MIINTIEFVTALALILALFISENWLTTGIFGIACGMFAVKVMSQYGGQVGIY